MFAVNGRNSWSVRVVRNYKNWINIGTQKSSNKIKKGLGILFVEKNRSRSLNFKFRFLGRLSGVYDVFTRSPTRIIFVSSTLWMKKIVQLVCRSQYIIKIAFYSYTFSSKPFTRILHYRYWWKIECIDQSKMWKYGRDGAVKKYEGTFFA